MKKKIYFIISTILQILMALYIIIMAKELVRIELESFSETYAMFPAEIQEEMRMSLENGGENSLRFSAVVGLIMNALILKEAIQNNLLNKKGRIIIFSVISVFTIGITLGVILSIINIIILAFAKRNNSEEKEEKSKIEIPKVEYQKSTKKELILGIILVLVYASQGLLGFVIPENPTFAFVMTIQITFYVVMLVLSIAIFKDKLKRDIKQFKDNAKAYLKYILPKLGITYLIIAITNLICIVITQQAQSVNQEAIEALPMWFVIPSAIIWAPIVEELIFRGVLRRFIKNDKLFIIASALIFGLLHTTSELTILNVFIMAIPYAILGGFLAYIYAKTDNITNNILIHAFQNTISTLIMLFI